MTTEIRQPIAEEASALRIRGATPKPPLIRRLGSAHADAASYLAGIGLALILAPIVEFLLTGESTILRYFSGGGETLEPPQWGQRAARRRVFGSPQEFQDALASHEAAAYAALGETAAAPGSRPALRAKGLPGTGASSSAMMQDADLLKAALSALSHPPTKASAAARPAEPSSAPNKADAAEASPTLGPGESPGILRQLWGKASQALSRPSGPEQGKDSEQVNKLKLASKTFDPSWQSKFKQLGKSGSGAASSGSSAAAAGGGGGMTLYQAAAAAMAAAQNAKQQALTLQQMGNGLNTNFEGPWQKDPFLAPLHADIVQAKTSVLSSASALQAYADQLESHAGALYNDAGAYTSYIQNPSGDPPSPTAQPVGPPPDISGNMAATQAAIDDMQRLLGLLQQAASAPAVGGRIKKPNTSSNFDGTANAAGGP